MCYPYYNNSKINSENETIFSGWVPWVWELYRTWNAGLLEKKRNNNIHNFKFEKNSLNFSMKADIEKSKKKIRYLTEVPWMRIFASCFCYGSAAAKFLWNSD